MKITKKSLSTVFSLWCVFMWLFDVGCVFFWAFFSCVCVCVFVFCDFQLLRMTGKTSQEHNLFLRCFFIVFFVSCVHTCLLLHFQNCRLSLTSTLNKESICILRRYSFKTLLSRISFIWTPEKTAPQKSSFPRNHFGAPQLYSAMWKRTLPGWWWHYP